MTRRRCRRVERRRGAGIWEVAEAALLGRTPESNTDDTQGE